MSLLPSSQVEKPYEFTDAFNVETQPSLTYKLNQNTERVIGKIDRLEAYKQAVYKLLRTERYEYLIYSWNYGVELKELFGHPKEYVVPELERRITEAIMQDDRTVRVHSFSFDTSKRGIVAVSLIAESIYGETDLQLTVEI